MTQTYLRSQSAIAADIREGINDSAGNRWTLAQVYAAMNRSLLSWGSRVRVPRYLTIDNVGPGTYEYELPSYVEMPIDVEMKRRGRILYVQGESEEIWDTVESWQVYPTPDGKRVIRFQFSPQDVETRIIWWAANGKVPTTAPTISGSITDSDASVTVGTALPETPLSGFLRIGREWMSYAGVTFGASSTTMLNLVRGLVGSAPQSHSSGSVEWGVAVHTPTLYDQLIYQSYVHLLALPRLLASGQESDRHFENMRLYQQMADEYWRRYKPARPPRWKGSREAYAPGSRAVEYTIRE